MPSKYIQSIFHRFGYEIKKIRPNVDSQKGFEIYKYLKADGSFNYEEYRKVQTEGNIRKIDKVWVLEKNISFLSDYIKKTIGKVEFGICHGTRSGKEQEWFRKYLHCEVIGTEISDTAETFPNTIQWDFHETKPEWINSVDFIYSNAFDHSYDPEKCLNAWMSCLKKSGLCILEHTSGHEQATRLDPFGAQLINMPYLILNWGKGKYSVREIIQAPVKSDELKYLYFIVIQLHK